jgi:hypothetical protein
MEMWDTFDSSFLGAMNDFEDLDRIVDQICSGLYVSESSISARLNETDKSYISQQVYNRTGQIINWI